MKKIAIIALGFIISFAGFAQNETDALRYSFLMNGGTARFSSMGGAFSALGADFSTLSVNPAGIGVYKSSEIMFSPQISFSNTASFYKSTTVEDSKASFSIPNFGMVFSGDISTSVDKAEWKNVQFGFGVNRLADFNNSYLMRGENSESSILDVFQYLANGHKHNDLNSFDTDLAWNTYLLNPGSTNYDYVKAFEGGVLQQKSINTTGGLNEMVISFGGNYNDKFYLGSTLGFPFLNYREDSYYKEVDVADTIDYFKSLSVNDHLSTFGSGFNFKFGMIYRIADWVRLSAAVHTPTFFALHDSYSRLIKSDLDTGRYESKSPQGIYDYKLTTPMRVNAGMSFVIGKIAAISAEYEMVDYSQSKFRARNAEFDFFDANEAIQLKYTMANNFKIGGEVKLNAFAIRAGFAHYGSPYAGSFAEDYSVKNITAGLGIREKNYYIDLAFNYLMKNESHDLYNASIIDLMGKKLDPVLIDLKRSSVIITMGVKF